MLNYKRLAPRNADPKIYTHNNEKITHQEADMINNGTFIEGETSVSGEYITAQEVVQKLAAQHKHVNYMIGGDELNELVCYYTWSSDTIDPTGVYIPDLDMTVEDRRLLAYEITPENADVTSAVFSIVSGSNVAHIDGSYVVADHQGTATYKVVVNGSIEDTATITVSNKPEEFPDDAQHRWIRVQPESSQISVDGGTIHVTGSYGLTGSYGTEKKVGDITDTIVIESNSSQDPKSGSKTYYYNNNQFDTPTTEITWTQPGRSEEFPDNEQHRWIEVSPTQFTFPADGGSVDITGSYGLTGTFGTRKKVGDITDTITVDANVTASSKSGSKTYYYNNDQSQMPTVEVSWTQPNKEEEFPEEWTYVFEYNISDTNGGSSTGTSWSRQYYANGQEINYDDDFILNGITSYRTKTGTLGTVQKENVQYSGQIGRPSGYNYSDQTITQSGQLVQEGSNKQLQWSYTQEANVKVWDISANPTSLHFEAAGGTQSVSVTTWYTWQTNDNNNQRFGETTTEEQITAEVNTSTQQKEWTETVTKNGKSVSINCTQDGREEVFTYKYFIKVGYNLDTLLEDRIQLVWQNDQYSQSSKKTFYIKSFKCKINERGETVATEQTGYDLRHNSSGSDNFSISNRNITTGLGQIDCFPIEENTSYQSQKTISFQVYNVEDGTVFCHINLIQERKGIQIISGDAVMFTYNWDKGKDLDQATFVNLNLPSDNNRNYAGYSGHIIYEYHNILYFAGDNRGTGNEYAFIDFKNIAEYIDKHRDSNSSIDGKTILESLTNDNGVIAINCNLYTNWFVRKESENITLSYSVYNKDQENAKVGIENNTFILTGYTKIKDASDQALCYAKGSENVIDNAIVSEQYTLSAKFTYYLNSGVFAFETNKDNVDRWQKGLDWHTVTCHPSCSNIEFTNDGQNINFSASLDSLNLPEDFNKTQDISFNVNINSLASYKTVYKKQFKTNTSELPYRIEMSTPLQDIINKIEFGENNSIEIYPGISDFGIIKDYSTGKYISIVSTSFVHNKTTIQKPSI